MIVSNKDIIYSVTERPQLSGLSSLLRYYMPLVGANAIALYLLLCEEEGSQKRIEYLLTTLNINIDDFDKARFKLEAFRLLSTYLQNVEGDELFVFKLVVPFGGKEFLSNTIYRELLSLAMKDIFAEYIQPLNESEQTNGVDVSATYQEVFGIQLAMSDESVFGRESDDFNIKLIKDLSPMIEPEAFSEEVVKAIKHLGSLTKISVPEMKVYIHGAYDSKKRKISVKKLTAEFHKKVKIVEPRPDNNETLIKTLPPLEYLYARTKRNIVGDNIAVSNVVKNSGLRDEVINTAVDYILYTSNDYLDPYKLSRVVGQLVRKKVDDADTANNILFKKAAKDISADSVDEILKLIEEVQK